MTVPKMIVFIDEPIKRLKIEKIYSLLFLGG